jgi:hypothetical protein
MDALATITEAFTAEKLKKEQVLQHLKTAISLLEDGEAANMKVVKGSGMHRAIIKGTAYRPGYIDRFLELLKKEAKPLKISVAAKQLQKMPEFVDMRRESLERAVFAEINLKKAESRLKKLGDGYYWLAGEAIPKSFRKETAA